MKGKVQLHCTDKVHNRGYCRLLYTTEVIVHTTSSSYMYINAYQLEDSMAVIRVPIGTGQ